MPLAIFNNFKTRAILATLMTRIIVGLIGIMLDSISSRRIPTIDRITMMTSSRFHCSFMYLLIPRAYNFMNASSMKTAVKT